MSNNRTKNLPGAVGVGDGGGIIRLDDVTNTQSRTIPNATPKNSGVMTKAQATQLAALVAGGGGNALVLTPLKIAAYNANVNDFVQCDPSGGAFNVTLPAAATAGAGAVITVKNKTNSVNAVTVLPTGGDTIDGDVSLDLIGLAAAQLVSDGVSSWMVA